MNSNGVEPREAPENKKRENDRRKIIGQLRGRIPDASGVGCFLCLWIVLDFEASGRLTDWPYDSNDKGLFPYLGKIAHIRLEAPKLDVKVGAGMA